MKKYFLKTKSGEVINSINAHSRDIAVEVFSKIKKISPKNLLSIFVVSEK